MSPTDKRRGSHSTGRRTAGQKVWDRQQRERRRELGQNFLKDERTAKKIVRDSGVTERDLVVELGAGSGMLTGALSRAARKVVAVEYDPVWAARLKRSFSADENVEIIEADALSVPLPSEPFKVVANIPFHLSTAILHRLLDDPTQPPERVCLLVQKELARKHARSSPSTLKTLRWSPWWLFEAGLELPAGAFDPSPRVGACLLMAAKREPPLVAYDHQGLFRAFLEATWGGRGPTRTLRTVFTRRQIRRLALDNGFSTRSSPSQLTVHQWASIFAFMVRAVPQSRWPMPGATSERNLRRAGRR